MSVIKSYSDNQHDILSSILALNGLEYFDADISYGNGSFYKKIPEPNFKSDAAPQAGQEDVEKLCSTNISVIPDGYFRSVVFDPPFLTYVKAAREHNSIMAKRFGGYWRYDELEGHYKGTIKEAHRILKKKGVLVFKCQDIIHNHKMHPTHINIVNWSEGMFRLKDMMILAKPHRMPMPEKEGEKTRTQKHARIHHSYFLVLEKISNDTD